jgi:hypothetical protein
MAWKREEDKKEYFRKYNKTVRKHAIIRSGRKQKDSVRIGYTNELLAAADLNSRCGVAYLNPVPQTKDDAFVKTSLGWRTVQVKTARLHKTKNGIAMCAEHCTGATSDIIAIVDDTYLRIRYINNTDGQMAPELPTKPTQICSGLIFFEDPTRLLEEKKCHSFNTSAPNATLPKKDSRPSRSPKSRSGARVAVN